jgi:hypothetical protein
MSHKSTKVSNQTQNQQGEVSLSLSQLSDTSFSGSLANNDLLKFNPISLNWENATTSQAGSSLQYIRIGTGESDEYQNSGASGFSSNSVLYLYDTSPINLIPNATINNYLATDWIESVNLPAGVYQFIARFTADFSASTGFLNYRLRRTNANQNISSKAFVNGVAYAQNNRYLPKVINSSANITTNTNVVSLTVDNSGSVDTIAGQGTLPSENSYLIIIKVG